MEIGNPGRLVVGQKLPELLSSAEIRCRRLFETAPHGIFLLDAASGEVIDANAAFARMTGYSSRDVVGRRLWEDGPASLRALGQELLEQTQRARYGRYTAVPLTTADGRHTCVDLVTTTYRVGTGEVVQCALHEKASWGDAATTTNHQAACKMAGLHAIARVLESCEDEDEACRVVVAGAKDTLGFPACTLYMSAGDRLVARDGAPTAAQREPAPTGFEVAREARGADWLAPVLPSRITLRVGNFGVLETTSPVPGEFGEEDVRLLGLLAEYAAEALTRIREEASLRAQVILDPLTGLYNRRYFSMAIAKEVSRSLRHGHAIGLMLADIDHFKQVNDGLGHAAGDRLLREVGGLLRSTVRGEDFVVRYGGDEFLIVLLEMTGRPDVIRGRILAALDRWNAANSGSLPFPLGLSMGDATWTPKSGLSIDAALAEADQRMYESKHIALNGTPQGSAPLSSADGEKPRKRGKMTAWRGATAKRSA